MRYMEGAARPIAYVGDLAVIVNGKLPQAQDDIVQNGLRWIEKLAIDAGLRINPQIT